MGLGRRALLSASNSPWLRRTAPRTRLVRRAVRRFMPGETLEEALAAAVELKRTMGVGAVLTKLGEDLESLEDAHAVRDHYLAAYDTIAGGSDSLSERPSGGSPEEPNKGPAAPGTLGPAAQATARAEISIKPTQLGLNFGFDACLANLERLAARADESDAWLWIDMESTAYTDATLDLALRLREKHPRIGLCVQAYLYRTEEDLKRLVAGGVGVRLVKGAYLEPKEKAFPAKADVDQNYLRLADELLSSHKGVRAIFATHDRKIIRTLESKGDEMGLTRESLEFQLLYGIQRPEQARLAQAGRTVRVLISYGDAWFPWYMRRLAERPSNVWFVLKNAFG